MVRVFKVEGVSEFRSERFDDFLDFIGRRLLPFIHYQYLYEQSFFLRKCLNASFLGKRYLFDRKNAWFFIFERFGQSHVSKEWRSFSERLRILTMKDCRILLF